MLSLGLCFSGDTERRVAFYDMEKDAYEEDDNSDYVWEGERLTYVVCSNSYKNRFLERVKNPIRHSVLPEIVEPSYQPGP